MRKLTHEEFLNKIKENNPNFRNNYLVLVSSYKGTDYPINIKCNICGQEWTVNTAISLLNKTYHCKFCNYNRKFTHKEYETQLKEINPNFKNDKLILMSTFFGLYKPITIKCNECSKEWIIESAKYLLSETFHCRFCNHGKKLSQNDFLNKLKQINENFKEGKLSLTSTYLGMNEPITVRCSDCDQTWTVQAKGLLRKSYNCKFCSSKKHT